MTTGLSKVYDQHLFFNLQITTANLVKWVVNLATADDSISLMTWCGCVQVNMLAFIAFECYWYTTF